MLLLKSCDGFENAQSGGQPVELLCCLHSDCIAYNQRQNAVGIPPDLARALGALDPLRCHAAPASDDSRGTRIAIGVVVAAVVAAGAALAVALLALRRRRSRQRETRATEKRAAQEVLDDPEDAEHMRELRHSSDPAVRMDLGKEIHARHSGGVPPRVVCALRTLVS